MIRRHVLVYGLICGLLIVVPQVIEYRWMVVEHSVGLYGGMVAAVFATLGIWLGAGLRRRHQTEVQVREVRVTHNRRCWSWNRRTSSSKEL